MSYEEKYKEAQHEQKKAWQRAYYHRHKEKMKAYHKEWRAAHPDYYKELKARQRAKRKNGRNNDEVQD